MRGSQRIVLFFLSYWFFPWGFSIAKGFNEASPLTLDLEVSTSRETHVEAELFSLPSASWFFPLGFPLARS